MMFNPIIVDGQVVGFWRRPVRGKGLGSSIDAGHRACPAAAKRALDAELARHEAFAGVPVEVAFV